MNEKRWLLLPGHLHKFFADGHALGKAIEGSGLDTIGVEAGIYSAAAIRSILAGKNYTRMVEFHLMNALAVISLKLESLYGSDIPDAISLQAMAFREALHQDSDDMLDIYEDLATHYTSEILPRLEENSTGLPKLLDNYLQQIEVMLNCIAAIHSRYFEGCLNVMDDGLKYYGSMDLPNYFKMIPVLTDV